MRLTVNGYLPISPHKPNPTPSPRLIRQCGDGVVRNDNEMETTTIQKNTVEAALDFLCSRNIFSDSLTQMDWVCLLMDFQQKKGDDALKALAGFYLWVIKNTGVDCRIQTEEEQTRALKSTFAHDLNGRNDEGMLPRSDNYLKFWNEEVEK